MLSRRDATRRPGVFSMLLGAIALLSAIAGYAIGRWTTADAQPQQPTASAQHREKHGAADERDDAAEPQNARASAMIAPGDDEELASALLTAVQHRDYFR